MIRFRLALSPVLVHLVSIICLNRFFLVVFATSATIVPFDTPDPDCHHIPGPSAILDWTGFHRDILLALDTTPEQSTGVDALDSTSSNKNSPPASTPSNKNKNGPAKLISRVNRILTRWEFALKQCPLGAVTVGLLMLLWRQQEQELPGGSAPDVTLFAGSNALRTTEELAYGLLMKLVDEKIDFVTLAATRWPVARLLCALEFGELPEMVRLRTRSSGAVAHEEGTSAEAGEQSSAPCSDIAGFPASFITANIQAARRYLTARSYADLGPVGGRQHPSSLRPLSEPATRTSLPTGDTTGAASPRPLQPLLGPSLKFLADFDPLISEIMATAGFWNGSFSSGEFLLNLKIPDCPWAGFALTSIACILSYLAAPANFEAFAKMGDLILEHRGRELLSSGAAAGKAPDRWASWCLLELLGLFRNRGLDGHFREAELYGRDLLEGGRFERERVGLEVRELGAYSTGDENPVRTSKLTAFLRAMRAEFEEKIPIHRRPGPGDRPVTYLSMVGGSFANYMRPFLEQFFRATASHNENFSAPGRPIVLLSLDEVSHNACEAVRLGLLDSDAARVLCLPSADTGDLTFTKYRWVPVLLSAQFDVMWLDFDVFLVRDPVERIAELEAEAPDPGRGREDEPEPYDLYVTEHLDGRCLNAGIFFVRWSSATLQFFLEFVKWLGYHVFADNQNGFDAFLGHSITESFVPPTLPRLRYTTLDVAREFLTLEGWGADDSSTPLADEGEDSEKDGTAPDHEPVEDDHGSAASISPPRRSGAEVSWAEIANRLVLVHFWRSDYSSTTANELSQNAKTDAFELFFAPGEELFKKEEDRSEDNIVPLPAQAYLLELARTGRRAASSRRGGTGGKSTGALKEGCAVLTAGVHSIADSKNLDLRAMLPNQEDFVRRAAAAKEHDHVMGMVAGEEEL